MKKDDEKYINMCKEAYELQIMKRRQGNLKPGDFFYDGDKIRVAGMDYVNVKSYFTDKKSYNKIYEFVLMEEGAMEFKFDEMSDIINIEKEKYMLMSFMNPIWLPRPDQIIELMLSAPIAYRPTLEVLLDEFHKWMFDSKRILGFQSIEQLWLAYYMHERHDEKWKDGKWRTEVNG